MAHPFHTAVQKALWRELRREGFRGSGATIRRASGAAVHVVNIQAASGGAGFYLNLGAHLTFLPTEGGRVADPERLLEYECAFRDRLEPPTGSAFPWAYIDEPAVASESIAFILSEWDCLGRRFFLRHEFPDGVRVLLAQQPPDDLHPHHLLTLARIALHMGDLPRAGFLATTALARTPERATLLRADLLEIHQQSTAG